MKKKNTYVITIILVIIGVMFFEKNYAATFHWEGSISTNWSDPNNWLEGSVPGSGDDVVFDWNALNDCTLDINNVQVNNVTIDPLYGYLITFPLGDTLLVSGNFSVGNPWVLWDNNANIIFNGTTTQTITIDNYTDWPFYDFTINKPSGDISLGSNILITNSFNNLTSTPILTNGFSLEGVCTPPRTGSIFTIPNSWGM